MADGPEPQDLDETAALIEALERLVDALLFEVQALKRSRAAPTEVVVLTVVKSPQAQPMNVRKVVAVLALLSAVGTALGLGVEWPTEFGQALEACVPLPEVSP